MDIKKVREVVMEKMQAMLFIQYSSCQFNGLRSKMENTVSKGRDEYPTTVRSSYNLMLEWQPEPGSMQRGLVQRDNHLAFAQHNKQGKCKRTANIYKNTTCYKCGQLVQYRGSCPFKENEQNILKEKGRIPDNIIQGFNRVTTCI